MLFFPRKHKVKLSAIDPLDNGLREEIAAERAEPDRFVLNDLIDMNLADKWEAILADARQDPDFVFVSDDEA